MITTNGKLYIKRFLAGYVPTIAESMAIGIGDAAATLSDTKMHFEIERVDVQLVSYDFVNDRLIFKTDLPGDLEGVVYEAGLFSMRSNAEAGEFGSRLVANFDSSEETWLNPTTGLLSTHVTTGSRYGVDSLQLSAAANGTSTARLENVELDFGGFSAADKFVMAYNVSNNVSNVKLKFIWDDANYYTLTYTPAANAYRINSLTKSQAVATGSPIWEEVSSIEVSVTATAGGAATVEFDGFRVEDVDTPNPDYVLVARKVLGTPFVKEAGRIQSFEFALAVTV